MTHDELLATNTREHPDRVAPRPGTGATVEDRAVRLPLPPHSWQMIRLKT